MKTTVEIPDELFRKAKTLAASKGLTFKDVLVHSLASELDNIIDIGISMTASGAPIRKVKKPLSVQVAISKKESFPKPEFIKDWNLDPLDVILEDRKKRNDFLLY